MKSARSHGDLNQQHHHNHYVVEEDSVSSFMSDIGDHNHMTQEGKPEKKDEKNDNEFGQYIGEKAGVLASVMRGSNGRDKICALVQYSVQLYTVCMLSSTQQKQFKRMYSVEVGERISHSISQGRKIFKFLKFLEPIKKFQEMQILKKNEPKIIKFLSTLIILCSFGLYFSDNMVWFANMGLIAPRSRFSGIGGLNLSQSLFSRHYEWRFLKDVSAFWKNTLELSKYSLDALRNYKRQDDINEILKSMDNYIVEKKQGPHLNPSSYDLLSELFSLKSKMRFLFLGAVQNTLRLVMLSHRLQNPLAYSVIHPIAVCVCGILSNIVAIMRVFRESRQVITLRKVDNSKVANNNQVIRKTADGNLVLDQDGGDFFSDEHSQMDKLSDNQRFLPEVTKQDINMNRRMEYLQNSQLRHGSQFAESSDQLEEVIIESELDSQDRNEISSQEGGVMSVEENKSENEMEDGNNNPPTATEDEQEPAIDTEGERIYDRKASQPDYKLFTLRQNSCLNFHQMINFDSSNIEQQKSKKKPQQSQRQKKEENFSSEDFSSDSNN